MQFESVFVSMMSNICKMFGGITCKEMNDCFNNIFFLSLSLGSWGVNVLIPVHN